MRRVIPVMAVLALVADEGLHARQRYTLDPTPLEAFAAKIDAHVVWAQPVGRLESGPSLAILTAVVVESASSTPRRMGGVRIELSHSGPSRDCNLIDIEWSVMCERNPAVAYVEESRLDALRRGILNGQAEVHDGHPFGVTTFSCRGCSSGDVSGILVLGYGFADRTLGDLAILVATAVAALENAPR